MRALVTGGAGFIGSNIADALIDRGATVVVLDDLSTGFAENVNPKAELVEGDIADEDAVARAVAGCDVIFHEAAHRAVFRSVEHPLQTDRANVGGTLTLLVAARDAGVRRVVTASSSSVYGGNAPLPAHEGAPLSPRSPYAVTKLAGEHYCRVFFELFGLETVSLRYFNVYGPRQRPDSQYAAVIPLFIDALRGGQSPEVHGDGLQSRDFTYISDVVAANLAAAEAPAERCAGGAFNIAGGEAFSLLDLLAILQRELGVSIEPRHVEARAGDVRHTRADPEAAAEALGFRTRISFDEGLQKTVAWFTDRPRVSSATD
jgi:UDP-glucose 4-epimerase